MTICVIGAGAREHALAHVLSRSDDVIVTPGNPGMETSKGSAESISVSRAPAEEIDADLYIVGPEAPLVDGLADRLRSQNKLVFGPSAEGAKLEGSKAYMKALAQDAGVPTARFEVVGTPEEAKATLKSFPGPYVVKTDGLAAGKGVLVTESLDEALDDAVAKLSGTAFGDAGKTIVIEEAMSGPELSLLVLCDGERFCALPPACDYKRLRDGDVGPNTGGMGAYSADELAGNGVVDVILDSIVAPSVAELRRRGIDYRGVLYAGCMLTPEGPKLVEYNVRFGDPEAEVVLLRLNGDVAKLMASVAEGSLTDDLEVDPRPAACVVLAASGYPADPRSGDAISGIDAANDLEDAVVFHGGTRRDSSGRLVTSGGRVLTVSAIGQDLDAATGLAYGAIDQIFFEGMQFRHDIARAGGHNEGMISAKATNV